MERNGLFFRAFFLVFTCLTTLAYEGFETFSIRGLVLGLVAFGTMYGMEYLLKKFSLRTLNTALIGLLVGSLIGFVIASSLRMILSLVDASSATINLVTLYSFLASVYIGIMRISTAQDSWWLTIPFVRLAPATQTKKRELLLDLTAIEDPRLLELARSGLLDHQLVVPTFLVKELQKSLESLDENSRMRARRCQEHLKRLETLPNLDLEIKEFHFTDTDELMAKLARAAKLTQAHILSSSEPSTLKSDEEMPNIISLDTIATALKPGAQRGEILSIKIQRLGKEPKQGVGYLEDGTMVVVNGGGEFLSETIRTQVLSQKYSSSGKIIFCNALGQNETPIVEGSPYHLSYQ